MTGRLRRRVGDGLHPQPASAVSAGHVQPQKTLPTFLRHSEMRVRLRSPNFSRSCDLSGIFACRSLVKAGRRSVGLDPSLPADIARCHSITSSARNRSEVGIVGLRADLVRTRIGAVRRRAGALIAGPSTRIEEV